MILATITFTDLLMVIAFYMIGWIGSVMLLTALVYALSAIWEMYRYSDKPNHNKFLKGIMNYYRWLGIDWMRGPKIEYSRIPFSLASIMALFACLGTISFMIAFIISALIFMTIVIWEIIRKANMQ